MLRYIVERISDGEFLELELPIIVSGAGSALMGPGGFSGEIVPVADAFKYANGDLLIDQYATFIHEEADGVIRGTWLVTRSVFDGSSWKIEGAGFSSYVSGRPYEGEFRGISVDLADVVRHIWAHAQAPSGADIGVTVTGMTGKRVGTDSDDKVDAAKVVYESAKASLKVAADKRKLKAAQIKKASAPFDAQIKARLKEQKPLKAAHQSLIDARKPFMDSYRSLTKQRTTYREVYSAAVKAGASAAVIAAAKANVDGMEAPIAAAKALVDARKPAIDAAKVPLDAKNDQLRLIRANKDAALFTLREQYEVLKEAEEPLKEPAAAAKEKLDAAKEQLRIDGGAWKIYWWDTPDCFQEMQEAVDEAGWEWVEWSGWNADRTKILKQIRLASRVGRKQDNLSFVEGDNIIEAVVIEDDSAEYANTVIAIGAGEGRDALRCTLSVSDGRRRKVHVVDAKNVTRMASLEKVCAAELKRRTRRLRVDGVRVDASHPNAEKGTFGVGDTILIDAEVGALGRKRLWHRIEEIEWMSLDVADLVLGDP